MSDSALTDSTSIGAGSDSSARPERTGSDSGPLLAIGRILWKQLTSYWLAVVVLLLLTVLTFFGTWEQKDAGLFDTQKKYFESVIVVHWIDFGERRFDVGPVTEDAPFRERIGIAGKAVVSAVKALGESKMGLKGAGMLLLTLFFVVGRLAKAKWAPPVWVLALLALYGIVLSAAAIGLSLPLPLPGGYILMVILFFNLLAGAIIKARKNLKTPGMLIAHSGILLLLLGAFVSNQFSTKGYMALYKGDESNQFLAYQGWQLEVMPLDENDRPTAAHIISEEDLNSVGEKGSRIFTSDAFPFEVEVSHYLRNSRPVPEQAPVAKESPLPVAEGYKLVKQDAHKEAEANIGGVYVTVDTGDGEAKKSLLWGYQTEPWVIEAAGKKWAFNLDRPRWDVPFDVRLEEFIFDRHPGTSMARKYESRITKVEGDNETPVQIRMNEPLRHLGYTFFQESYGPKDEANVDRMYSQFSVVNNPADQWPLYSLVITGVGMTIHFCQKLFGYIRRSQRSRA